MRELATVQRIANLSPIIGADSIECATILGWKCVVKKGEFKEGDSCVYIEIDSILPDKPEFEFMRSRKFRVRTIKLRGQISQGLALPISILPVAQYEEGRDVTDLVGVKKYDPEAEKEARVAKQIEERQNGKIARYLAKFSWYKRILMIGKKRQQFPSFVVKTDETRIQKMPWAITNYKESRFDITEKLDGSSATYVLLKKKTLFGTKFEFMVCSRNFRLYNPDNSIWWDIAKSNCIKSVLEDQFEFLGAKKFVVIQGEIVGPTVQGNKYGLTENRFYVFNLIVDGAHRSTFNVAGHLDTVPRLESKSFDSIDDAVQFSIGKSSLADTQREGIVCRLGGISFKVINPEFLLKHGE